jgi:hypothetical protein
LETYSNHFWQKHNIHHNEEHQAARNNPLERVMTIRTRPDGADIETTTERFAQRLGKHLDRAFKGSIEYGAVEYFIPMANKGPRRDNNHQLEGMFKKVRPARPQPF